MSGRDTINILIIVYSLIFILYVPNKDALIEGRHVFHITLAFRVEKPCR